MNIIYLSYETLKRLNLYFNPFSLFRDSDMVIRFLIDGPKATNYINYLLLKKHTTHLANKGIYYSFIKTIKEYRSKFIIEIDNINNIHNLNPLLQHSLSYINNDNEITDCKQYKKLSKM